MVIVILSLTASVLTLINKSIGVSTGRTVVGRVKDLIRKHRRVKSNSAPLLMTDNESIAHDINELNDRLEGIVDLTEKILDLVNVSK